VACRQNDIPCQGYFWPCRCRIMAGVPLRNDNTTLIVCELLITLTNIIKNSLTKLGIFAFAPQ
jgi:hypothetical protein